jgi:exopolyphosphatase / guanosine-5'-triphosphate,3'-diphosphate pyrophosphatase
VTRVAALDCGTNSLRLLVADVDAAAGTLVDVDRRMEVVRLGEGVDRTGRLSEQALRRTLDATHRYASRCVELGVQRVRFVATSATRDAGNRDAFVAGVRDALGVEPEVVTGALEAELSFAGATRELHADGVPGPYLAVDIGGGSTELVLGTDAVEAALSVDVGCVRLTERHLHADPPTGEQVRAATADVDAALDVVAAVVPLQRTVTLVGLAGSVTTVTAAALDLPCYDSERIHRSTLPADVVRQACDRLLSMPRAERAALPYMHPGRVDVIGAGALVWRRVVDRLVEDAGVSTVMTSEHDILDGMAWSLA